MGDEKVQETVWSPEKSSTVVAAYRTSTALVVCSLETVSPFEAVGLSATIPAHSHAQLAQ